MKNRIELRAYIRYQLSQLGAANGAHAFEQLCFELARRRQVSNLLPATGPVQSGGDQGRDFESYRTYLASTPIAQSTFLALASQDLVVGACTLERNNIQAKVRKDLTSIFGSGERPVRVLYYCQIDVPVAIRHKLEAQCLTTHGAALNIHDGQAIADQLSDPDTFWIATEYLSVPSDMYPKEDADADYGERRARWLDAATPPHNYADFLDVKLGLRTATQTDALRPDLGRWMAVMRRYATDGGSDRLQQKARYEIAVAQLRGWNDLDPALPLVEAYFADVARHPLPVELLDSAVLVIYCLGAVQHGHSTLQTVKIREWAVTVGTEISAALARTSRRGETCSLLEARAMLTGLPLAEDDRDTALDRVLAAWSEVLKIAKDTPQFPVAHIADLVELIAPLVEDRPAFRSLRDQIDELTEARTGRHAVAARSMRRATAHIEAGNRLAAIDELQKAKVGWFSGDEMANSVRAMMLLSECYTELGLHIAARYYAAGATYLAIHSDDDEVRALAPTGCFVLANTFFKAGEGLSALMVMRQAIGSLAALTAPAEQLTEGSMFEAAIANAAVFRLMARTLAPEIENLVEATLSSWPVKRDELNDFLSVAEAEKSPWRNATRVDFELVIGRDLGVSPFSDLGRDREVRWSALGILWVIRYSGGGATRHAALELAATLQIIQVELAGSELLVIPTIASILVETAEVAAPKVQETSGENLNWQVVLPQAGEAEGRDAFAECLTVAATVLGQATAMSAEQFKAAVTAAFERGLAYRAFSVRPARELMAFADAQLAEDVNLAAYGPIHLKLPVMPHEPPELAWPTTPGPGYTLSKARKALENRYRIPFAMAGRSLDRILADCRIQGLLQDLRETGVRDWQILGMLHSMVCQYQIEVAGLGGPGDLSAAFMARALRPEQDDDAEFDLMEVTSDRLQAQLAVSYGACFHTWGLKLNRQSIDPEGMRKLLDVRYRQAVDDIPHRDIWAIGKPVP